MRLRELSIINFKGISELVLTPKNLTVLRGDNGTGKTSVLDAIAEFFEGGHHPEHIRIGAKKAELVMTLEDGKTTYTVKKTITPKGYQLVVNSSDQEEPLPAPKEWLDQLANGISYDPVRFIEDKKERAKFLQSVLAQSFEPDEILDALPRQLQKEAEALVPKQPVDLDGLEALRKRFYTTRTERNAVATKARNTAITLKKALPEEGIAGDPDAALKDANAKLAAVSDKKAEELSRLYTMAEGMIGEARDEFEQRVAAIRAEHDQRVAKIREDAETLRRQLDNEYEPKILEAKVGIENASKAVRERGRFEEIANQIAAAEKDAEESGTLAERLTRAIEGIDELKKRKLSESPIEGAEFRDGELFIDGIPFDQINTQRQYELAFAFGAMRPGGLGLMICDRAEAFSAPNFHDFKQACAASGFQVILARVDGEAPNLEVEYA